MGAVKITLDTKDSGKREEFKTGSKRDTREGKGRYDLIPSRSMRRIALVFERGAKKYGERNWEKGQPISRYLDSALRHTFEYLGGLRDEDHLAQAAWNLIAALHTEEGVFAGELPADLYDLPDCKSETTRGARIPVEERKTTTADLSSPRTGQGVDPGGEDLKMLTIKCACGATLHTVAIHGGTDQQIEVRRCQTYIPQECVIWLNQVMDVIKADPLGLPHDLIQWRRNVVRYLSDLSMRQAINKERS